MKLRPRPLAALLVLVAGCGGGVVLVPEARDLQPASSRPVDPDEKGAKLVMSEAKTDRLSIVPAGEGVVYSGLELPAAATFAASLRVLDGGGAARGVLGVELAAHARGGGRAAARAELDLSAGPWLSLELPVSAPGPIERLELSFARRPGLRLAVVRPLARCERPVPDRGRPPARRALLVTTDTLRADVLSCYGGPVRTPALDRLAEEGALFERCYTAANVTNPSHTSMFTSLYPKDHKVVDNFTRLAPDVPSMLEPLRAAGVRTAAFVSSFNFLPEKSDFAERFDELHGCRTYFERRAEDVNAELLPWLTDHADASFFVWAHYFDAHMPYAPPSPYDRLHAVVDEGRIELPLDYGGNLGWFRASDELGHYRALYRGEVSYLDDRLGELFDHLRRLGLWDDLAVVVVSDHGEALGEHGVYCDHASLFDEVTRVPLLVKAPRVHGGGAGLRSAELVSTVDLYPTLFELLDLPVPPGLRGASLAPLLRGEPAALPEAAFSSFARGAQESLRTRDRRLLIGMADERLYPRFELRAGEVELWREGDDPAPVTAGEPELARRLEAELRAFLEDARDYEGVPMDAEQAARIQDLGYAQREPAPVAREPRDG